MKYYIVIPAHNEQDLIGLTLQSLVSQTVLPSKVVVVNDNSTDKTEEVVLFEAFAFIRVPELSNATTSPTENTVFEETLISILFVGLR